MIFVLGVVVVGLTLAVLLLFARLSALDERVARLEGRGEPWSYRAAPALPVVPVRMGSEGDDPEIAAALQEGNLIAAIKRYRELTGAGLAESKAAVEAMRDRYR
jgi:ribosomal protein L7/L12